VRWNWSGPHAAVENPVIAILNPRRSPKTVSEYVERLYAEHRYTLGEQFAIATGKRPNPYPAKIEKLASVHCGHNPWIEARVMDVVIEIDSHGNDTRLTADGRELLLKDGK
jgi:hypothetical protein